MTECVPKYLGVSFIALMFPIDLFDDMQCFS